MTRNPYRGPREFEARHHDFFFGREEEIQILASLAQARRVSLLFGPSGAGKSSLVKAGLIPTVSRETEVGRGRRRRTVRRMTALPVATVGRDVESGDEDGEEGNVFVGSLLESVRESAAPDSPPTSLTAGLRFLLDTRSETDPPVLLVVDQLEDLFTRHPERWRERADFIDQIGAALRELPWLHVLLVMREDFIAELTPFAHRLPGRLEDRYRLERLRPEQAAEAISRPTERTGGTIAPPVVQEIIDSLRRIQIRTYTAATVAGTQRRWIAGPHVEPVHLQIVCRRLWAQSFRPDAPWTIERVDEIDDVDDALRGFYEDAIATVLETCPVSERELRAWFDETPLITGERTRGLVHRGASSTETLPNATVEALVETYLIRPVEHGTDTWYELAHDRLVRPVLASNRRWRLRALSPLTRAAQAWEASGRSPDKLYTSARRLREELAQADQVYGELEIEFVRRSARSIHSRAQEERRLQDATAARRKMRAAIAVSTGLLIAVGLSIWGWLNATGLRQEKAKALQRTYWLEGRRLRDAGEIGRSVFKMVDAIAEARKTELAKTIVEDVSPAFGLALLDIQELEPTPLGLAVSENGREAVLWSAEGAFLWAIGSEQPPRKLNEGPVEHAWIDADGSTVAFRAEGDSHLRLLRVPDGAGQPVDLGPADRVVFGPEQRLLAVRSGRPAVLWTLPAGGEPESTKLLLSSTEQRSSARAEPAAAEEPRRRRRRLFRPRSWFTSEDDEPAAASAPAEPPASREVEAIVDGAAFSPDRGTLVTWEEDGAARLWTADGRYLRVEDRNVGSGHWLAPERWRVRWGADGSVQIRLGAASLREVFHRGVDGARTNREQSRLLTWSPATARVWDVDTGALIGELSHGSGTTLLGAIFEDPNQVLSWAADGTVRRWRILEAPLVSMGHVRGVTVSSEHDRFMTWRPELGASGEMQVWDFAGAALTEPITPPPGATPSYGAFGRRGINLLTWDEHGDGRLWPLEHTGESAPSVPLARFAGTIWGGASNDEGYVAIWGQGEDRQYSVYVFGPGGTMSTLPHEHAVISLSFLPNSEGVLTFSTDGVRRWPLDQANTNRSAIAPVIPHPHLRGGLLETAAADAASVLTWGEDGAVRRWTLDGAPRGEIWTGAPVAGVALGYDGHLLVWSQDRTAIVFATDTRAELATLTHDRSIAGAAFHPSDQWLLTWTEDGVARVWDWREGTPIGREMGQRGGVRGAAFDHAGDRIVTWGNDQRLHVWRFGADLDFPPDLLRLQLRVLTGLEQRGSEAVPLRRQSWLDSRDRYRRRASDHLEHCPLADPSLYRQLFPGAPEDAARGEDQSLPELPR